MALESSLKARELDLLALAGQLNRLEEVDAAKRKSIHTIAANLVGQAGLENLKAEEEEEDEDVADLSDAESEAAHPEEQESESSIGWELPDFLSLEGDDVPEGDPRPAPLPTQASLGPKPQSGFVEDLERRIDKAFQRSVFELFPEDEAELTNQPTKGLFQKPSAYAPLTTQQMQQLRQARKEDGENDHKFLVMFLDRSMEEGKDFLLYAFPTVQNSGARFLNRVLGLKHAATILEAVISSVSDQQIQ
eukprot:g78755.t1